MGVVVMGDDGSAAADLAWMWINSQGWDDWSLDLLSADPTATVAADQFSEWNPEDPRLLLNPAADNEVHYKRTNSDPRVALSEYDPCDVMVIGPRGRGLLKAMHLGSTAEWLIHNPPHPLVIVRHGAPVHRAVVCTDGSEDALAAASALAGMPWVAEVDVTVLVVEQTGINAHDALEAAASVLRGKAKSVDTMVRGPDQFEVFYHVRDIVLTVLEEKKADLVVVGTRGLSRWQSLRAGSISTSVAMHAPCSAMLARAL